MRPALSVILFTTLSGAGYGMLFWLGCLAPLGLLPDAASFGVAAAALGLALVSSGLLASLRHLAHPERAWRALTQWRTSWLSREGILALATYAPAVLFPARWFLAGRPGTLGFALAAMAMMTVACTGMIYASLKPIRQWHDPLVLPIYLLAAAYSGGLWLAGVAGFWHAGPLPAWLGIGFGMLALAAKLVYWRRIDRGGALTTRDAIGLAGSGPIRQLDPPHYQETYVLREMGCRIARKHAARLRVLAVVFGFVLPLSLVALIPLLAAPIALAGMLLERWLFFAEATHAVTLYYDRPA